MRRRLQGEDDNHVARTTRKAPEGDYLLALKTELETAFQHDDVQIDRSRAVREMTQPSGMTRDMRLVEGLEIRDPTFASQTFQTAAKLGLNLPDVHILPDIPDSDKQDRNATHREKWSKEVLRQSGRRPMMHTYAAICDGAVADGAGWSKFMPDKDIWASRYGLRRASFQDQPGYHADPRQSAPGAKSRLQLLEAEAERQKRLAGVPFRWMPVDARTVYPVYEADEIGAVLEVTQRPLSHTLRKYRLALDSKGQLVPEEFGQGVPVPGSSYGSSSSSAEDARAHVQFLEYWDNEWCAYYLAHQDGRDQWSVQAARGPDGKPMAWQHGYGRHPYFVGWGLTMNHWRNRKVGWGTAEVMRQLVELRSFLYELMGQVAARDTYPNYQEVPIDPAKGVIGETRQSQGTVERWGLREIWRQRNGARLELIPAPPVADALKMYLALINEAIDKLEAPRFNGELGGLQGAGFAINQVLSFENIRLGLVVQSIEQFLEEMVRFSWALVRGTIKEKVFVFGGGDTGWLGMGPDELTDTVNVRVELKPEQASAQLIEQRMIHESLSAGTIGWSQAIEELGRNPDEVRRDRRMQQLRESDLGKKLFDQAFLSEMGRGDLEALTLQAEQLAQGGIVPGMNAGQIAQMQQQRPGMAAPPAMGNAQVPDMGNLALAPGGVGAAPSNGSVPGQGSMAGPPAASVQGAPLNVQQIGG